MKIAIICQNQFGYHIDTYNYVKNLSKSADVTYFSWDYNKPKYEEFGEIVYVKRDKNILIRNLRYIFSAIDYIFKSKPDIVLVKYFKGAFLLKVILPWKCFVLDIRTVAINRNSKIRYLEDLLLKFEAMFFKNITVVSDLVAEKLNIKRYKVIPLGANVIADKSCVAEIKDCIDILYVGTLTGRNIDVTVEALAIISKKIKNVRLHYHVVGDGLDSDVIKLKHSIRFHNLSDIVVLHGYLKHHELEKLFHKAHIGLAYVPITEYYDIQPSTKIYEYVRSNIPVVATNTRANDQLVDDEFGIVVGEDAVDFANGILRMIEKIQSDNVYFSDDLKSSFSWSAVVKVLESYLRGLL